MYDEYKVEDCKEKILKQIEVESVSDEKPLKLIYQWVISRHISLKEFKELIRFVNITTIKGE